MHLDEKKYHSLDRKVPFGLHRDNGTWAEAKERCSGWEEDAATTVHIKDLDHFYHFYVRMFVSAYGLGMNTVTLF